MTKVVMVMLGVTLIALLGTVVSGFIQMMANGRNKKMISTNKYMRMRVILQFIALILFSILITIGRS